MSTLSDDVKKDFSDVDAPPDFGWGTAAATSPMPFGSEFSGFSGASSVDPSAVGAKLSRQELADKPSSSRIPILKTGRVIHLSNYHGVGATATFTGAPETVLVIDASMLPPRERPPLIPEHVTVNTVRVDILDDAETNIVPHIRRVVPLIDRAFKDGQQVFVNCAMGISRSASLVIGYLMFQGMTFSDAFDYVQRHRSVICPNEGFHHSLNFLPVAEILRLDEMVAAVIAVRTAVVIASADDIKVAVMAALAIITAEDSVRLFTVACRYSFLKDVITALGDHYGADSDTTREILNVEQSASKLRSERLAAEDAARRNIGPVFDDLDDWGGQLLLIASYISRAALRLAESEEETEFEYSIQPPPPAKLKTVVAEEAYKYLESMSSPKTPEDLQAFTDLIAKIRARGIEVILFDIKDAVADRMIDEIGSVDNNSKDDVKFQALLGYAKLVKLDKLDIFQKQISESTGYREWTRKVLRHSVSSPPKGEIRAYVLPDESRQYFEHRQTVTPKV